MSLEPRAIFTKFFMHVAYIRHSVFRHVHNRRHHLLLEGVFFPIDNAFYSVAFVNYCDPYKTADPFDMLFGMMSERAT